MSPILCEGCGLKQFHCVCDLLEPVPARTPMRVIRHTAERNKSSNTGILLSRVLPDCKVFSYGQQENRFDPSFLTDPNLVLVYPGPAGPLPANPTLLLLDGSWPQVRKMYHRIPGLTALPCLPLPAPSAARLRMRKTQVPNGMSTLEAAASALALIEDPQLSVPLLRLFDRMTDRQLRHRGLLSTKNLQTEEDPG